MHVHVNGKRLTLSPAQAIGKGGEADVYDIGQGLALKLWKAPGHPDLLGDPALEENARRRIDEQQGKLGAFPRGLPARVVAPLDAATDRSGRRVVGYTMRLLAHAEPLLRLGERASRPAGTGAARVPPLFLDLLATVSAIHRAGVVIGDFNDLNVLVTGAEAHLIDADSFQFGPYPCGVFTERFVDPLLCDPRAPRPVLSRPHGTGSDWYAFTAMLFRSLLLVDPFGGVYQPPAGQAAVPHPARPLRRISVLHAGVKYPRPAEPPDVLPDDLLHHFVAVFERDVRGAFPAPLLQGLRFTRCSACGAEHARAACPRCRAAAIATGAAAPAAVREVTRVCGRLTATRVFRTNGVVVEASSQRGRLAVLSHDGAGYRREDGRMVLEGALDPRLKWRLMGDATLVGRGAEVLTLRPGAPPERTATDRTGPSPAYETNGSRRFLVRDGRLLRDGLLGEERIGDVLTGQTEVWAGPRFGLGFYRAAQLFVGFVFDVERGGLDDTVKLPRPRGQVIRSGCSFTEELAWLHVSSVEGGRGRHLTTVVDGRGQVLAVSMDDMPGELVGACAAGRSLFVPTDDGLVRLDLDAGTIQRAREYPDTAPFLDAACRLLPAPGGLYVVDRGEITHLTLA